MSDSTVWPIAFDVYQDGQWRHVHDAAQADTQHEAQALADRMNTTGRIGTAPNSRRVRNATVQASETGTPIGTKVWLGHFTLGQLLRMCSAQEDHHE